MSKALLASPLAASTLLILHYQFDKFPLLEDKAMLIPVLVFFSLLALGNLIFWMSKKRSPSEVISFNLFAAGLILIWKGLYLNLMIEYEFAQRFSWGHYYRQVIPIYIGAGLGILLFSFVAARLMSWFLLLGYCVALSVVFTCGGLVYNYPNHYQNLFFGNAFFQTRFEYLILIKLLIVSFLLLPAFFTHFIERLGPAKTKAFFEKITSPHFWLFFGGLILLASYLSLMTGGEDLSRPATILIPIILGAATMFLISAQTFLFWRDWFWQPQKENISQTAGFTVFITGTMIVWMLTLLFILGAVGQPGERGLESIPDKRWLPIIPAGLLLLGLGLRLSRPKPFLWLIPIGLALSYFVFQFGVQHLDWTKVGSVSVRNHFHHWDLMFERIFYPMLVSQTLIVFFAYSFSFYLAIRQLSPLKHKKPATIR